MAHVARGEFSDAASLFERNVALEGAVRYERFGTPSIQSALSGARLGDVLSELGRFDEDIGHAEAAVARTGGSRAQGAGVKTLLDHSGRVIRLTRDRLEHILLHPEMAELEAEIAV
jgi:hypothetical protein